MKRLVVLFVALFAVSLGGDSHAQHKRRPSPTVKKPRAKKRSSRAKAQPQPLSSSEYDELALAP
jgi:hypothetical protein